MPDSRFDEVQACVFDAYGTLFDIHSAAEAARDQLDEKTRELSVIWRERQLQYTWLQSLMGRHADFWEITGNALDYAMKRVGLTDPALRSRLMELYLQLSPFPEVTDVLTRLRESGRKTAILSNGDMSMLISAAKSAGIYALLDEILSVQSVGIFKPHPSVYQLATDRLKIPAGQIAFQSSNSWDAHGATSFGFLGVWVNRGGQPPERLPAEPQAEIRTLAELPALFGI